MLDKNGIELCAGDLAHVKRGSEWMRVWVRAVRVSPYGKKRPEVLIDNGERWDTEAAGTATFMAWEHDPKKIAKFMRAIPLTPATVAADDVNALRQIAAAVGCSHPDGALTDLDGLVSMVRGLAERAETVRVVTADRDALRATNLELAKSIEDVDAEAAGLHAEMDARIADAVAADRAAVGAWLRDPSVGGDKQSRNFIARSIEHGDHIDDGKPPLPSLRMVLLLRDELHRQIATLTAERDRRIDPVEHARAVIRAWMSAAEDSSWWVSSPTRTTLLARVGADVLAEVER